MTRSVIITCALTGDGDTVGKNPSVPVNPEQIAHEAIEVAKVGAAVVHIHVRDPATGKASHDLELFRQVVERIRESEVDLILNLTTGFGADLYLDPYDPRRLLPESEMLSAEERLAHVEALKPEICSLDVGPLYMAGAEVLFTNLPGVVRRMAKRTQEIGVKPELEVFDTGHLWLASALIDEGVIDDPPLFQLCLGIRWGAPGTPENLRHMVRQLPPNANWTAFSIGANQFPMAEQSLLMGGNIRVGLEDNLYLSQGVLASNVDLVERAVRLVDHLGGTVQIASEARDQLGLKV